MGGIFFNKNNLKQSSDFYYEDEKTSSWLLFSGFIYNKEYLYKIIKSNKDKYSIPELIYILYLKEGTSFVNAINGDFIISIFDSSINKLFLYRDHLGIHPLTWTLHNDTLCFSSDELSLCHIFQNKKRINPEYLAGFFKMIEYNQLPNIEINKLLPGHFLQYSKKGVKIVKYWFPEKIKINNTLNKNEVIDHTKILLENAVRMRSNKNLKAASHLSGGLDSGIVAAFARQFYSDQDIFYGFSWSPSEVKTGDIIDVDERELVKEQCKMNQIEPVFITLNSPDYLKYASNSIKYDQYFEENKVHDEACKKNIQIVFSGYGGDEFLSKGNKGIDMDLFLNLNWSHFFTRYPLSYPKPLLRVLFYEIIFPLLGFYPPSAKKLVKKQTFYLKDPYKNPHWGTLKKFHLFKSRRSNHIGYLYMYWLPRRIENWYVRGYKKGLFYKYPLLDKDLIEYILTIPSKFMIKGEFSRSLPREISEGLLPESVRWKRTGRDPVYHYLSKKNIIDSSLYLINKFDNFRNNPDLDFIDFDKLEIDVKNFKKNPDSILYKDLMFSIFKLYILDGFTVAYKKLNV